MILSKANSNTKNKSKTTKKKKKYTKTTKILYKGSVNDLDIIWSFIY